MQLTKRHSYGHLFHEYSCRVLYFMRNHISFSNRSKFTFTPITFKPLHFRPNAYFPDTL